MLTASEGKSDGAYGEHGRLEATRPLRGGLDVAKVSVEHGVQVLIVLVLTVREDIRYNVASIEQLTNGARPAHVSPHEESWKQGAPLVRCFTHIGGAGACLPEIVQRHLMPL